MVKILVVEDHSDTANLMKLVLQRYGYDVRSAASAAEGLAAAAQQPFDLCICDYRLPDGDGATLARRLTAVYQLKCICLSGDGAATDLEADPANPFAACLTKPLEIETMLGVIDRVAGQSART